mgnify:FL=1
MQTSERFAKGALLRISQIVGNPNADPPIPPLIPVAKSTWWLWVKAGKAPAPIKLSDRVTVWRASDVDAFMEKLTASQQATA